MPYYDEPGVRWDDPLIRWDDPRTYQQVLNDQQNQTPSTMYDVALDISRLSVPDLISRARQIKAATEAHDDFAALADDLTALGTAIDALVAAQSDMSTAKAVATSKTEIRDTQFLPPVVAKLNALGIEIGKAATSEAAVEATTLRVSPPPGPKPVPSQPTGLELTFGDEDGVLAGQCDGQPGIVDYYEIRYTTGDPLGDTPGWQFADTSKKSRFELSSLPSGEKVWIAVRACNARGKSPWSDPACKRVP
ncbi:MAG: hypothetical protein KDN20_04180 [Verrucomicrobiae bacterium]|nr:hypothetical protein [Verrucomicrobiae bacterium]